MTDDQTYNGWKGHGNRPSAYATWRVMLEMGFGDNDDWSDVFPDKPDEYALAGYLRDLCSEYIHEQGNCTSTFVSGWADAFVDEVDFREIAEHILSDWED